MHDRTSGICQLSAARPLTSTDYLGFDGHCKLVSCVHVCMAITCTEHSRREPTPGRLHCCLACTFGVTSVVATGPCRCPIAMVNHEHTIIYREQNSEQAMSFAQQLHIGFIISGDIMFNCVGQINQYIERIILQSILENVRQHTRCDIYL